MLGSAGGPARALPLLESDRFLIVNGDTLADVDLRGAGGAARRHQRAGHHGGRRRRPSLQRDPRRRQRHRLGLQEEHRHGTLGTRRHLRHPGTFHFIGVQAVNASAFAGVSPDQRSETVHGIYPGLIAQRPGSVRVMRTTAEFFDIGTPRDYLETALTARRARRPAARSRPRLPRRRRRHADRHHPLGRRHDRRRRLADPLRRRRRRHGAGRRTPCRMLARYARQ